MADLDLADALADADPVAVVLAWLQNHPQITELLGGPDHVSGISETPWPHLSLSDGVNGDLRGLVWNTELEVTLQLTGAPDGAPGVAALRRTLIRLLVLLTWMTEEDYASGGPVVARVRPAGVLAYQPLTNGQPRFTAGVMVVLHPPVS